jgi:hypothetical protein
VFELYLGLYLAGLFAVLCAALKHFNLLVKTPTTQLEEKRVVAEQVMGILHQTRCPLCNSNAYVESVDLFKSNTAILVCENEKCSQKSMWKLEKDNWKLIAPFKYSPTTTLEIPIPRREKEEDLSLVFAE